MCALAVTLGGGLGAGAVAAAPAPSSPEKQAALDRLAAYDEALVALTQELSYVVLLGWGATPLPVEAVELPGAIGISASDAATMIDQVRFLDEQRGPAALAGLIALGEPVSPAVETVLSRNLPIVAGEVPRIGTEVYLAAYDQLLGPWSQLMDLDLQPALGGGVPLATTPLTTAPLVTAPLTTAPAAAAPLTTAPLTTAPLATAPLATVAPAVSPTLAPAPEGAQAESSSPPVLEIVTIVVLLGFALALLRSMTVRRRLDASGRASGGTQAVGDDVLDAGRTIMAAVDLDGFLRAVAEQVGRLVGDQGAVVVHGRSWVPHGYQLPSSGVLERAMTTGRTVTAEDTTVVPIVADGQVVGALVSWSRRPDTDSALGAFAPLVGAALQGVRTRVEHEHLAFDDGLTGVGNRRRFDRDLDRFVGADSGRGMPVALAMVDVDHFKRFNDTYGHQVGDAVLQHVAQVISANVRTGDLVYRYGGEEFSILLPGADLDDAIGVVERVRVAIASSPLPGEALAGVTPVTVSVGVSVTPPADAAAMVRGADGALYAAKSGGRNRVEVFAPA